MTGCSHSFNKNGLHAAALGGNDDGVLWAIDAGADINALDSAGRTAIMCAVAGENWRDVDTLNDASFMTKDRLHAIKRMLRHPDISLLTINAPQNSLNGVTPLGMAAWLDAPDLVKMLLEESADAVAVDGMDNHGATALMYAARDGRLEVVQILLSHGARPDFRDCNHRTSTQYALSHPHILWLCEQVLRSHRWRECQLHDRSRLFQQSDSHLLGLLRSSVIQPPTLLFRPRANTDRRLQYPHLSVPPSRVFDPVALTRVTRTIISCVESEDLPFLYSILFPPPALHDAPATRSLPLLVNRPDEKTGWSPIHYCAASERPNVHVLDALYCAGADVALFTKNEEATALHVLAMLARLPERGTGAEAESYDVRLAELYDFTIHLISDLRAPLSARDRNDETCIHIAAERGMCIELLMILLECDTTSSVRDMRNSRGLIALDVAKPEFRVAFGQDAEKLRCVSSVSTRTIRPADSFASLASFKDWNGDGRRYSCSSSDTGLSVSQYDPALAESAAPSGEEGAKTIAGHEPNDDGELELDALVLAIMENLNNTSVCLQPSRSLKASEKRDMLDIVERTSILSRRAISIFRSRLDDVSRAVEELKEDKVRVDELWKTVDHLAENKAKKLNLRRVIRRRTLHGFNVSPEQCWVFEDERERGSEDSQTTAVSHFLCPPDVIYNTRSPNKRERKTSVLRSPSLLSLISQKLDIAIPSSPAPSSPSTSSSQHAPWHGIVGSPLSVKLDPVVVGVKAEKGVLDTHASVGTQTVPSDSVPGGPMIGDDAEAIRVLLNLESSNISRAGVAAATAQMLSSWPEWLDGYFLSVDSVTYYKAHLANLMKIEQALPQKAKDSIDPKIRQMVKSKRKLLQEKIKEMEAGAGNHNAHGTKESRVKTWLKKMVGTSSSGDHSHHQSHIMQGEEDIMLAGPTMPVKIVYDINEDGCNVAREVKDEEADSESFGAQNVLVEDIVGVNDPYIEAALRTSKVILMAAGRDLVVVDKVLRDAEDFLSLAIQATSRAERAFGRTLKRRKMKLTEAMEISDADKTVLETAGGIVSPSAELGTATFIMSGDDEDVRIIRRLLLRKIEGQTCDAWDELERVVGWLRIIKEVVRGVKRRAYL
ncbi:hypothetical protein APHAL10511_007834 [Amanita phalloides]|nr:hypothetical protein APHAL10511_007834 [Amanita phalloides]